MKAENSIFITLENENLFDKDYAFVKNKLCTIFGLKAKEVEKQLKILQTKKLIDIENGKIVKSQSIFTEVVQANEQQKVHTKKAKTEIKDELLLGTFVKQENDEVVVRLRDRRLPVCKVEQTQEVKNSIGKTCVLKVNGKQKELFGEVQNIFGLADDPISENNAIAHKYGFTTKFSEKVLEEARNIPQYVTEKDREGRNNLEHLPIITIDPPHALNLDDGIYDEPIKNGFRTYIAIADVSHYIKPGSELDKEGLRRAIDAYLGGGVFPMFPPEIANGICSLNENVARLAVVASCDIDYNRKTITNEKFQLAVIKVKKAYTYEEAEKTHLCQDGFDEINKETKKYLDFMYKNTKVLEEMFSGMLEFDDYEPQYKFSADGTKVEDISLTNGEYSHNVVKFRMMLKDILGAKYFKEHNLKGLYRIHEKPTQERFNALVKKLKKFNIDYNLQNTTKSFQGLIEVIKKHPARHYLMIETVKTLTRAKTVVSPVDISHFGIGIEKGDWGYMFLTSPIRRETDLINQRELKASLLHQKSPHTEKFLNTFAEYYNIQEKKADDAEAKSDEYLACMWANEHKGEILEGYIEQINNSFINVITSNGTVPVLIATSNLKDDAGDGFKISKDNMSLVGKSNKYTLGETIKFKIHNVDFETHTTYGNNKPEFSKVKDKPSKVEQEKELTK